MRTTGRSRWGGLVLDQGLEALQHEDVRTVQEAISALGMHPIETVRKSIPILQKLTGHRGKQVSATAGALLRRLLPKARRTRPVNAGSVR